MRQTTRSKRCTNQLPPELEAAERNKDHTPRPQVEADTGNSATKENKQARRQTNNHYQSNNRQKQTGIASTSNTTTGTKATGRC
jgi:hypothetical protein